ncbi:thiopeptide-type bacteriocin biosynthesis protein [Actinomadura roseirufa]|uniref:thiopeptide-type bacteriocin biosynthesis protein n=1 Tax=Actinomadura roseirufa TaxID=2094049 RepID=UPI0010419E97|nr:thiopeptide-type bacteriocin biosynthesis protein [Actinomadura roseirufa]
MTEHEWLYYRVYVAGLDEIRDLVERVVAPMARRFTADHPGLRWFFLQYADRVGLQLRLRLNAPPAVLAELESVLDARFAAALDDPGVVGGPDRRPEANRMAVKRLYEPEHAKFGGPAGTVLAERLMQLGSEAALAFAHSRHRQRRMALTAAHTELMIHALPEAERTSFLHQYAWYWSGGGRLGDPRNSSVARLKPTDPASRRSARWLRAQIEEVLSDLACQVPLTTYVESFWRVVRASGFERSPYLHAFHHIHLMNNRLGTAPHEEMLIARLLWVEGDAHS